MEETTTVLRKLKRLGELAERYRELREMLSIFKRFKVERYHELCVFPEDAEIGKEQRVILELEIRGKLFRSLDEPLRIAKVVLKVPKRKKRFFPWSLMSDRNPCKWSDWRAFEALDVYEAQKHTHSDACDEYIPDEDKHFPVKYGDVVELKPGSEWRAVFVFDVRHRSPYNRPLKLCFYDDYGEFIDCKTIFLEEH